MRFLLIFSILLFFQCGENKSVNSAPADNKNAAVTDSPSKNQNTMENTAGFDDLEYAFDVKKVGEEYVEITYKVTNKSAKSYLIFNQGDTNKGLGNGKVYVEPQAEGLVELSQKRFTEPAGKKCPIFEIAVSSGASWLKPNETLTQTVKTSLPLQVYTPFDVCTPKDEMPKDVKKVKFCLGIAEADPERVKLSEKGFVESWQAVGEQKLLCGEAVNF